MCCSKVRAHAEGAHQSDGGAVTATVTGFLSGCRGCWTGTRRPAAASPAASCAPADVPTVSS